MIIDLSPYEKYPNVVITGHVPPGFRAPMYSLDTLRYTLFYHAGLPRISSTPLGVNSFYNRNPWIDQGSLQTRRI
jgi:hypothetical protein